MPWGFFLWMGCGPFSLLAWMRYFGFSSLVSGNLNLRGVSSFFRIVNVGMGDMLM